MNEDHQDWWSNAESVVVDGQGTLWKLYEDDQFDAYSAPGTRTNSVGLDTVTGEMLGMWHTNGWDFAGIKRSIEVMLWLRPRRAHVSAARLPTLGARHAAQWARDR